MEFRGHLRLPEDAGTGIPVVLRVDDIYIVLTSDGEDLGSWRADEMSVERMSSDQFSLDLAGELMVFLAADALGFAYEGVTAIKRLQARLAKGRVFGRKKAAAKTARREISADVPVEAASDEPVMDPQPPWSSPISRPATRPAPGEEPPPVTADPEQVPRQLGLETPVPADTRSFEFEVEEVGLATGGGSWIELDRVSPEPSPEPEPEPGPEPEVESVPEIEAPAAEEPVFDPEPVAEPEPLPESTAAVPEPAAETEPSEVDAPGRREEVSPAKRPSLFRRWRDKSSAAHDHVYGEAKTISGLKRSVCDICGHVTFSGEDVYQGW